MKYTKENKEKKKYPLWARGFRNKSGSIIYHPYLQIGFKFESEQDAKK